MDLNVTLALVAEDMLGEGGSTAATTATVTFTVVAPDGITCGSEKFQVPAATGNQYTHKQSNPCS